jgi:hypothetical protein
MTILNDEHTRDKLKFYSDRNQSVHITLKLKEGFFKHPFRNGKTLKFLDDSIIFIDEILGEIIIFLSDIIDVEKREERR